MDENQAICLNCGFRNGQGDKFCSHCGSAVLPGQALCVKCGFMLNGDPPSLKTNSDEEKERKREKISNNNYKKHIDKVKKVKELSLIVSILSIVLIFALIFLPIFKCEYQFTPEKPVDMTEIEDWDEMGELVVNGSVTKEKSFSLWDDIMIVIKDTILLMDADNSISVTDNSLLNMASLLMGLYPFFIILEAITLLCIHIKQLLEINKELKDIDTTALLMFNEIRKSGKKSKKESFWKSQSVRTLIIYIIADILFIWLDKLILDIPDLKIPEAFILRNMINLTGISFSIFILLAILISYFLLSSKKKSAEKELLLAITQEEYNAIS